MTDALTGQPRREPTLRERANAPRIGRARFIGNAIGYSLLLGAIGLGIVLTRSPLLTDTRAFGTGTLTTPNPWVILALTVLDMVLIGELAIRRRHDRGASSLSYIVWLEVSLGATVLHLFGPPSEYTSRLDVVLGAFGLWFFVLLVLLPGTKGPNRYGPDPRVRH